VGPLQIELRIKAMQSVLIPGPNMASPLVQGITGALGPGISVENRTLGPTLIPGH